MLYNKGDIIDTTKHGFLTVECPLPFIGVLEGKVFYWCSTLEGQDVFYWEEQLKEILTEGELFLLENDIENLD